MFFVCTQAHCIRHTGRQSREGSPRRVLGRLSRWCYTWVIGTGDIWRLPHTHMWHLGWVTPKLGSRGTIHEAPARGLSSGHARPHSIAASVWVHAFLGGSELQGRAFAVSKTNSSTLYGIGPSPLYGQSSLSLLRLK